MSGKQTNSYPLFTSWRFYHAVALCAATALNIAVRQALNFGIVCMVVPSSPNSTELAVRNIQSNITIFGIAETLEDAHNTSELSHTTCLESLKSSADFGYEGEFHWSREQVGYILGAFFYGYLPMQFFAGILSTKFGGKYVIGFGSLVGALGAFLTPASARVHPYLLIAVRAAMGLGMGVTFPTVNAILGRWALPHERAFLLGVAYAGPSLGGILSNMVSGFACQYSWTISHYLFGGLTLLWVIVWFLTSGSGPDSHKRISVEEQKYILTGLNIKSDRHNLQIPWKHLLSCPAVWAICAGHFSIIWAVYTLIFAGPLFSQDVLKFNIKQNGLLNSIPGIISVIMSPSSGMIIDKVSSRVSCPTSVVRKICQTIANLGCASLILGFGFLDCSTRYLALPITCVMQIVQSFNRGGVGPNAQDIAPRMCGVVYGIANTCAQLTGLIIPFIIGMLTTNGTSEEWQSVFLICSGVLVAGLLVFIIFGSGEVQDWDKVPSVAEKASTKPLMSGQQAGSDRIYKTNREREQKLSVV